ncbi:hypothetical protein OAY01_00305 [Luminiphilus sp.]|nr:hypothetical protein [Luminiphilus sp.]
MQTNNCAGRSQPLVMLLLVSLRTHRTMGFDGLKPDMTMVQPSMYLPRIGGQALDGHLIQVRKLVGKLRQLSMQKVQIRRDPDGLLETMLARQLLDGSYAVMRIRAHQGGLLETMQVRQLHDGLLETMQARQLHDGSYAAMQIRAHQGG